jgi:hypothetical protein
MFSALAPRYRYSFIVIAAWLDACPVERAWDAARARAWWDAHGASRSR